MPQDRLSNEEFFSRLSTLFGARRTSTHGSLFLTQKRLTTAAPKPPDLPQSSSSSAPFTDLQPPANPLPVLIRATDGNSEKDQRIKISTVVQADDLEIFFVRYAECWKTGMSGLKKRDRSGRKAKAKGKKKKNEGRKEG